VLAESLTGDLLRSDGARLHIGGYTRGITECEGLLVVASSARRLVSKSNCGNSASTPDKTERLSLPACLTYVDPHAWKTVGRRIVHALGNEIFDIIPLHASASNASSMDDAALDRLISLELSAVKLHQAVRTSELDARNRLITAMTERQNNRDRQLAELAGAMKNREAEIERLKMLIEKRNEAIRIRENMIRTRDNALAAQRKARPAGPPPVQAATECPGIREALNARPSPPARCVELQGAK
jgi:hypothetical protein